jgi:hypothetical protein
MYRLGGGKIIRVGLVILFIYSIVLVCMEKEIGVLMLLRYYCLLQCFY